MLTLLFGLLIGSAVYFAMSTYTEMGLASAIAAGVVAMFAFQLLVMLAIRKISARINAKLQTIMQETSAKMQSMQAQFMRRPVGQKAMIQLLEKEQNAGLRKLIETLDLYKPLYWWNMLMKRQVNTMRMIFLFQMKKFDEADALMDKCVFFDAQSVCVRLARMFKRNEDPKAIDKFFRKKGSKFKGENAVLPYSLYAWILVKQERFDDATKVLADGKTKSGGDEVIARNWDLLVNKKVKHFSNSGLGEPWYALMLEEPKIQKIRQQPVRYR